MKTLEWPPVIRNGRLAFKDGPEAAAILIVQTVGDLRQNPFNPDSLSLGDLTFKSTIAARSRIEQALKRLTSVISIEAITEVVDAATGDAEYTIVFLDRETRTRGEVRVG